MAQENKPVSDWAWQIARNQSRDVQTMAENLEAARRLARREAMEEAAKVALVAAVQMSSVQEVMAKGADRVAAEIRALIDKEENAQCPPPKC